MSYVLRVCAACVCACMVNVCFVRSVLCDVVWFAWLLGWLRLCAILVCVCVLDCDLLSGAVWFDMFVFVACVCCIGSFVSVWSVCVLVCDVVRYVGVRLCFCY